MVDIDGIEDVAIRNLCKFVLRESGVLNLRYRANCLLNYGSFGAVFKAIDLSTNTTVALKGVLKATARVGDGSAIQIDEQSEEKEIHERLGKHRHVVEMTDSFETPMYKFLVLEYCAQGDLYEAIRYDRGPRETEHVRAFMLELVTAVEFLHLSGVSHRDIKPENIFLTENGHLKLGDFGLATRDLWSYEAKVGSDRYMAPEQYDHQGSGLAPARADIWSIGICLLNILFCRNPFDCPSPSDKLFTDFLRDRQALFDVFPNMSLDTFDILAQCLTFDPEKRSLSSLREALLRAVCFTTDDEILDEFCTEERNVVTATANREPLRTPSITSPPVGHSEGFQWSKAVQQTPLRQMSVVPSHASEDLFPGSEVSGRDWCTATNTDTQSVDSVVDSGLGVSIESSLAKPVGLPMSPHSRSKPITIAESLPTFGKNVLSSFIGRKVESKSWSDMQEEDEMLMAKGDRQKSSDFLNVRPTRPSRVSTLSQVDSESDGRSTPRAGFAQLSQSEHVLPRRPSTASQQSSDDGISGQTGFMFEDDLEANVTSTRYSPPSKRRNFMGEKWSALGDWRRNALSSTPLAPSTPKATATMETPRTLSVSRDLSTQLTPASDMDTPKRSAFRAWKPSWASSTPKRPVTRHGGEGHQVWTNKQWSVSTDWRRSDLHLPGQLQPRTKISMSQLDGIVDVAGEFDVMDVNSGLVGGRDNLHL